MSYNHETVFTRNNPSINKIGQLTNNNKIAFRYYDEFTDELILIEIAHIVKPQLAIVDNNGFVTFKSSKQ